MSLILTGITALPLVVSANLLLIAGDSTTITATNTSPALNEQFTVTVTLTSASGFSCWGQLLTWDTSKLRLDSQESLTSPFGIVVADSRSLSAMQSSGQVRTGGYYEAAGPTYPDNAPASGGVAVFTFTRIDAGSTDIAGAVKSGTAPFGLVQIDASGVERSPSGSLLTLTDPVTTQVATPGFNPTGGTYTSAQSVTLTCATAGATIHYTLDGSVPSVSSSAFTGAIVVATTTTITAMAVKSGLTNSSVSAATYTISSSTPGTSAPPTSTTSGSKHCGLGSGIAGLVLMGFLAFAYLRRRQP